MKKSIALTAILISANFIANAQLLEEDLQEATYLNWFNKDIKSDKIMGSSVDKAYEEILANKSPKRTVIVAVLDNGIDTNNTELKSKLWVNEDEIPNNNIDDDNNGYVDDIYGWNFLGNKDGDNIYFENLEYTRLCKEFDYIQEHGRTDTINKADVQVYQSARVDYDAELKRRQELITSLEKSIKTISEYKEYLHKLYNIHFETVEDFEKITTPKSEGTQELATLYSLYAIGFTPDFFIESKKNNQEYLDYMLNLEFNPREIIGDNPKDINESDYGNNDVTGPKPDHGTGCAGLIAADRNNEIGIQGVASDVKIMCVRTVPKGDERDKDVALAIRYAVDNGANIINMSFGKSYSPEKELVDDAIKYAESKGVLLVHAAGNDAKNLNTENSYPTPVFNDGAKATNMITVGASTKSKKKDVAASFSNYGNSIVDVFAPGDNIISLDTGNVFAEHSGTSFAGPVVAGIAAVIWAYYPELTPQELIQLLIDSSMNNRAKKILAPGSGEDREKILFDEAAKGGVANLYEALMLLQEQQAAE